MNEFEHKTDPATAPAEAGGDETISEVSGADAAQTLQAIALDPVTLEPIEDAPRH